MRPATIPWLQGDAPFPAPSDALETPNGLLAAGADLSAERLLAAYRRGIFPWYSPGDPILWWSPDPRMVLHPAEVKVSRSLAKVLRNRPYTVRCDTAFAEVIDACAAPREDQAGTWITPEVRAGYLELHRLGYAHAFETWIDGELAGGLYGVAVGRMFFGESMFSRRADASKIALVHAARWLGAAGFGLIDCQMHTEHLESMGARAISRSRFLRNLAELVDAPSVPGPWHLVATTLDVRDGASPV